MLNSGTRNSSIPCRGAAALLFSLRDIIVCLLCILILLRLMYIISWTHKILTQTVATTTATDTPPPTANATTPTLETASSWRFVGFQENESMRSTAATRFNATVASEWCAPTPIPNASGILLESPKLVHSTDYASEAPIPPIFLDYARVDYSKRGKQMAKNVILLPVVQPDNPQFGTKRVPSPIIRKAAVCKPSNITNVRHFPHAMQELFMCFDYWIDTNCDEILDCVPVLLTNSKLKESFESEFVWGVLKFLESSMDLVTISEQEYYNCHYQIQKNNNSTCSTLYHPEQSIRSLAFAIPPGYVFHHSKEWNIRIEAYLNETGNEEGHKLSNGKSRNDTLFATTNDVDFGACPSPPRIRFLNRRGTRKIINADQLTKDVSGLVYAFERLGNTATTTSSSSSNKSSSFHYQPRLSATDIYFEEKSFWEQVEFFRETDIVISGHGAQLTGLVFMANDALAKRNKKSCKHVVELFPKHYAVPYFFGSLAVQSGIGHSFVYYDGGLDSPIGEPPFGNLTHLHRARPLEVVKPWEQKYPADLWDRVAARDSLLCPRSEDIINYLSELVTQWYRCNGC